MTVKELKEKLANLEDDMEVQVFDTKKEDAWLVEDAKVELGVLYIDFDSSK